jgi:hypothetical protein
MGLSPANDNATSFQSWAACWARVMNLAADGAAAAAITPIAKVGGRRIFVLRSSGKVSSGMVVMNGLYNREGDGVIS